MANLFDMKGGEYAAVTGKLAKHISPAVGRAILDLKDEEVLKDIGRLIEERLGALDRITVPHLSASALVAQAKERRNINYLDSDLAGWNFVTDERGKTCEVLTQKFGRNVSSDEVRTYFRERGFKGNTAAFVAWVSEKNPEGYCASIPEDDQLWPVPRSRDLRAPCYRWDSSGRGLSLRDVRRDWSDAWVFVAFRELPQRT